MISILVMSLLAAEVSPAQPEAEAEVEPKVVMTKGHDRRLIDISADMLEAGEWQINLAGAFYSRGILPWLSLTTSLLGDVVSMANLSARVRLLDTAALRLTAEVGGGYLIAGPYLGFGFALANGEVRATIPLNDVWEVSVAPKYRLVSLKFADTNTFFHNVSWTTVLIHHDPYGAMYLDFTVPALTITQARANIGGVTVAGTLALDNLPAWSVMLGRDQRIGQTGHLRLGVGYRNRPGIIVLDSFGNLMVSLDYIWR